MIDIIIPAYNGTGLLRQCLDSVNNHSSVTVVDNASRADLSAMVLSDFPSVSLVRNEKNLGFGAACNRGVEGRSSDIILFLNSDTVVPSGTIERIESAFLANPQIGALAPKLVDMSGENLSPAGIFITSAREMDSRERRDAENRLQDRLASGGEITGFGYLSGAALAIRADLFRTLGGFDEDIFLYFEDADLCQRAVNRGYDLLVLSEAEIFHTGSASIKDQRLAAEIELMRSRLYYIKKHEGEDARRRVRASHSRLIARRAFWAFLRTVLTLGLVRSVRRRLTLSGGVLLWLILGEPRRESGVYRRLFGRW